MTELFLAIDQGTTSSRAIAFSLDGTIAATAQEEFTQHFPNDGWVEHDAEDIWTTTLKTAVAVVNAVGVAAIKAIGITNQRETTLVWDRKTGEPIHRAIVWQDRRTTSQTEALKAACHETMVRERTGLVLDPYFSATKIGWILDNVPGAREKAIRGELAFGTVDSFLIWRLTGGVRHVTDATNASRTSLFNIHNNQWDTSLLDLFNIPESVLPEVLDCADDFGTTQTQLFGRAIPITGVAGDQQAAAIGQACLAPGDIKSTYGTGCFVLMNTGTTAPQSQHKLLTTTAYRLKGESRYALEGSIFVAGAAIQWVRDGLGLLEAASESEALARSVSSTGGVALVPAFTGLGAPHWAPDARGLISGITRDTTRAHIVRAALEAMAFQTHDLLAAFAADGGTPATLRVDGGMVANGWLMHFLADILDISVDRPKVQETTALGAAYLAALGAGRLTDLSDISTYWQLDQRFDPNMAEADRNTHLKRWAHALRQTLTV